MPSCSGAMPEIDRESSESSPERVEKQPENNLKVDRKIRWQPENAKNLNAKEPLQVGGRKPSGFKPPIANASKTATVKPNTGLQKSNRAWG